MRRALGSIILVGLLLTAGCGRRVPGIPKGHFRLFIETRADKEDLLVTSIGLAVTSGIRLRLDGIGGVDERMYLGAMNQHFIRVEMILVAALIETGEGARDQVLWLPLVRGGPRSERGYTMLEVQSGQGLGDLVNLSVEPGDYLLGQALEIGRVGGEPLVLTVQSLADAPGGGFYAAPFSSPSPKPRGKQ